MPLEIGRQLGERGTSAVGECFYFKLLCQIFMFSRNSRGTTYNYVISSRLGRKTYKEQYAFLYK